MVEGLNMADESKALVKHLKETHPMFAFLGGTFTRLGGVKRFDEWADDNYGDFIKLMFKSAPPQMPQQGVQGEVNINLHPSLMATEKEVN